jgi:hypothetical protein
LFEIILAYAFVSAGSFIQEHFRASITKPCFKARKSALHRKSSNYFRVANVEPRLESRRTQGASFRSGMIRAKKPGVVLV